MYLILLSDSSENPEHMHLAFYHLFCLPRHLDVSFLFSFLSDSHGEDDPAYPYRSCGRTCDARPCFCERRLSHCVCSRCDNASTHLPRLRETRLPLSFPFPFPLSLHPLQLQRCRRSRTRGRPASMAHGKSASNRAHTQTGSPGLIYDSVCGRRRTRFCPAENRSDAGPTPNHRRDDAGGRPVWRLR